MACALWAGIVFPCGSKKPNAQVQGRALGVAEASSGGGVPCNAQLGWGAEWKVFIVPEHAVEGVALHVSVRAAVFG